MKRFKIFCLLIVALLGVCAATSDVSASWGCGAGPPQCVYGGPNSQCDSICGVGLGVCQRPGCCYCIA